MPEFTSAQSKRILTEVVTEIRVVLLTAIVHVDLYLIYGLRSTELQQHLFANGKSEKDGVIKISKHQVGPGIRDKAEAIDLQPYPSILHGKHIWNDNDFDRFTQVCSFIKGIGVEKGIELRWGGDWDGDFSMHNQSFNDLGHLETVN